MHVRVKRIYEKPEAEDGQRVLVDRLWPRGIAKEEAAIDAWARDLAPSDGLRRWYDHDPGRFARFARAYRKELEEREGELDDLLDKLDLRRRLTLLTATRDVEHSHARVLEGFLQAR